jgi:VWFA-related protein
VCTFIPVLNLSSGQETSAQIHVSSKLVTVNAVVMDKQDNPITNLAKGDFLITDGGQPQELQFFSKIESGNPVSATPAPGDYTNAVADGRPFSGAATIILFDTLHSHWTSQGYGLNQVRAFLRQINPQANIGVYVLGDELKIVHEYTQNSSDLVAAIRDYDARRPTTAPEQPPSSGIAELDSFLTGKVNHYRVAVDSTHMPGSERRMLFEDMFRTTVAALEQIAMHLEGVHGRKTLIWVTDGISAPLLSENLVEELKTTYRSLGGDVELMVREMNRVGIAVYPVSAEGLQAMNLHLDSVGLPPPDSRTPYFSSPSPGAHIAMLELAERTGGRAFYDRNDLVTGMTRALDDSRVSYSLGYYPDHHKWNGEFRKIQVKVSRPNATVLARDGYFALPDPKLLSQKEQLERMKQIAASPVDATGFPFAAHIMSPANGSENALQLKLLFDPDVPLSSDNPGNWRGMLDVLFLQTSASHKLLDATDKSIEMNLTAAQHGAAKRDMVQFPVALKLMPGAETLCIILSDPASDTIGSLHIALAKYIPATMSAPEH